MSIIIKTREERINRIIADMEMLDIFEEKIIDYKNIKNIFLTTKGDKIFFYKNHMMIVDDLMAFECSVLMYQKFYIIENFVDSKIFAVTKYVVREDSFSEEDSKCS